MSTKVLMSSMAVVRTSNAASKIQHNCKKPCEDGEGGCARKIGCPRGQHGSVWALGAWASQCRVCLLRWERSVVQYGRYILQPWMQRSTLHLRAPLAFISLTVTLSFRVQFLSIDTWRASQGQQSSRRISCCSGLTQAGYMHDSRVLSQLGRKEE